MPAATPSNSFFNGLTLVSRCPLCAASFDPLEAKVLGESNQSHLLHIRCNSCGHALLALVVVSRAGVSSLGLVTDCSPEDALHFQSADPIAVDDVLAAHLELRDSAAFIGALLK